MRPDLSKLETDYQILTELHRSDGAQTFLARHLVLNRDVTITVVRGENALALRQLAADAIRLTSSRHPNIVPVVEGRWLDAETFAVIHARVRGSTLDQLASAVDGTTPAARVGDALRQVNDALTWARNNGVVHRHVIADDMVFQQGSGRVLVALSALPSVLHGAPESISALDQCADARTIGELAFIMLSGQPRGSAMQPLNTVRPDLPPPVVDGVQRLMRCTPPDRATDVPAFLALLGAGAAVERQAPAALDAPVLAPSPVKPADTTVVAVSQPRGMSFGARFAMAVLVLIVIGAGAFALWNRNSTNVTKIQANAAPDTSDAAGEIATHARDADSALSAAVPPTAVPSSPMPGNVAPTPMLSSPTIVQPPASQYPTPYPSQSTQPATQYPNQSPTPGTTVAPSFTPLAPPTQRRHEPTRPVTPPIVVPPSTATPPDTAVTSSGTTSGATTPAATGDVCNSPAAPDQQKCLSAAVARGDRTLNDVYQQLISALRRQANVQPGNPDPPAVQTLRGDQRRWLEDRDAQCHDAGAPPLYARDRADCFADKTNARVSQLQQQLQSVPPASPDTSVMNSLHARP